MGFKHIFLISTNLNFLETFLKYKGPFIYYVSTCRRGEGGSENVNFCLFSVLKTCLRNLGGRGVQKS